MEELCDACGNYAARVVNCPSCPCTVCVSCLSGSGCKRCTGLAGAAKARIRVGWGDDSDLTSGWGPDDE